MDEQGKAKLIDVVSEKIGKLKVDIQNITDEITHLDGIRTYLQDH